MSYDLPELPATPFPSSVAVSLPQVPRTVPRGPASVGPYRPNVAAEPERKAAKEINWKQITQATSTDAHVDSRRCSVDLRFNPTVNDENVEGVIASVHPLHAVTFLDLSFTLVSPTGLAALLPKLTSLVELSYQSPICLADFPVNSLPESVCVVHLDDSNEWCLPWRSQPNAKLRACWERSRHNFGTPLVTSDGPNSELTQASRAQRLCEDTVKELYRIQNTAIAVQLDCNSASEGAWEVDQIEQALGVLPKQLKALNFIGARDRKFKNRESRSTPSEFWEDRSDPDMLGTICRTTGKTLEHLELNIPHIPRSEFHYFEEMPNLRSLILKGQCNISTNTKFFPCAKLMNLTRLDCNLTIYADSEVLPALCSMVNLVHLNIGSDWRHPDVFKAIGNSLTNLKSLSVDGQQATLDALATTSVANKLESIISFSIQFPWIAPYLLNQSSFKSLKFIQLVPPQTWTTGLPATARKVPEDAESFVFKYPPWKCDHEISQNKACAAVFDDTPRRQSFVAIRFYL